MSICLLYFRQGSVIMTYVIMYFGSEPISVQTLDALVNNAFATGNFLGAEIDENFTSHTGIDLLPIYLNEFDAGFCTLFSLKKQIENVLIYMKQ